MAWRKWFVRLLVITVVCGCAGAVILYQQFTNPTAVREKLTAKLKSFFPGAVVTLDSARLRILGGISVNELRVSRKDDPEKNEILHVPSAFIYHDKEKILDGEWALRRVELFRPHLRARRNKDGTWNLKGISAAPQGHALLPTLIIHNGTLILEDFCEGGTGTTIELTDVNLQVINDPLPTVTIEGSANSTLAGKLHMSGHWQRLTKEITLSLNAEQISLAGVLTDCLEKHFPVTITSQSVTGGAPATPSLFEGLKLEGKADLQADLAFHPEATPAWTHEISLKVIGGKVRHPKLPLPLDNVTLSCRCSNGYLFVDELTATSGPTEITAHGSGPAVSIDQNFEAHLEARHLDMTKKLFAALPVTTNRPDTGGGGTTTTSPLKLYTLFSPRGLATFRIAVARRAGDWCNLSSEEPSSLQLVSETMGATFLKFPYPLENLKGTVDMNIITKLVQLEATGEAGTGTVLVKGTWQGKEKQVDCRFDIEAAGVTLDESLIKALPPQFQKLAKEFNATGKGNMKAHIRHDPGAEEFHNEYHTYFYDTAVRWDPFPYALDHVTGYLDIYPKMWEFREGKGTHQGGLVAVKAKSGQIQSKDGKTSPAVILHIEGNQVPANEDLHLALAKKDQLGKSWDIFRPRGLLNFETKIVSATPDETDVQLKIQGPTIEPVFFPYALDDVTGWFHYHDNKLDIQNARARHEGTTITLESGSVDLYKGGGSYTDLNGLKAEALQVDESLIQALPGGTRGGLRSAATSLQMQGPLWLTTRLIVSMNGEPGSLPDIGWDGQCRIKNAKFATGLEWSKVTGAVGCRGRYNGRQLVGVNGNLLLEEASLLGQPFHNVQASFHVEEPTPDVLMVENLRAPIFGGDISAKMRVNFNSSISYVLDLTGSQIDLAQFGQHNLGANSKLQGKANARLYLTGKGTGKDSLEGNGSVDVPNGRLYNLPLLMDVLKFLKIRGPDHTSFEEIHAQFSIHGQRVALRNLELLGKALSLSGQGEFNLDGTDLAVDLYSNWPGLEQLTPAAIRPATSALSKNLLTIEMRGKISAEEKDRKFTLKPVPGIVNPILRMTGAPNQDNREEPRAAPVLGEERKK